MAEKSNLNVNPYFDDFDYDKNFYRVLFNPAKPVQTRELNTLQSILQSQIESFGSHTFKEGSVVIPGNITYNSEYCAVKLNSTSFGVDISQYIEKYVGKTIRGSVSGITATISQVIFPDNNDVENITIYVKYLTGNNDFKKSYFTNGESLTCSEDVSYGINNVLIPQNTPFASLISDNATAVGSSISVDDGIYFVRGYFVRVKKHTLILDYYTNISSYRVGFKVSEGIVTSKEDSTLFDNAKGFTNYSSPGADRFKISLSLTKKDLKDVNDEDFVELLRVENGLLKKLQQKTEYNLIKDYIAQRTYDESGNYTVNPFGVSVNNSLNNFLGNNGIYFDADLTASGNTPSDDLMCLTISPGKAYVRGYDIEKTGTTILDVEKPRKTESVKSALVPFNMGNILQINNVSGLPSNRSTIYFYSQRKDSTSNPQGVQIGSARVYLCKLVDSAYEGKKTKWDLYLYDIQFYSLLTLNLSLSSSQLPQTSQIVGNSSGAIGFVVSAGTDGNVAKVRPTYGKFLKNESISINGISTISRYITDVKTYDSSDIKSVYRSEDSFLADTVLSFNPPTGFSSQDLVTINTNGSVTSSKSFSGITTDSIISYTRPGFSTDTYNIISTVSDNLITVSGITTVNAVGDGAITDTKLQSRFLIGSSNIKNQNNSYLYSVLPDKNISSVDLNNSQLSFSAQSDDQITITGNTLQLNVSNFDLYGSVKFDTFDPEKYSIVYTDGTIESLTDDQVTFNPEYTIVTFKGVSNKTTQLINGTFVKSGIQSKVKTHKKNTILDVTLSKYAQSGSNSSSSINDGLTFNPYYGLRIQDNEICLRYADVSNVLCVYESLDSNLPSFDKLEFSALYNVSENAIVGENIIGKSSKSAARIVKKDSLYPNFVEIVYLNSNKFQIGEEVVFKNSGIVAPISSLVFGRYKNITNSFILDKGQRNEYYDYSRLVRRKNESEPSRKLSIVFDHYEVSQTDVGDLYTILSYNKENYNKQIPDIGFLGVRASDTLDFRPMVSYFSGSSSSPFDFQSRNFGSTPKVIITPNESSLINYDFYLGRVDTVTLDSNGELAIQQGVSSKNPYPVATNNNVLEIAKIYLPPYLYDPSHARISFVDSKRYTMKDIGILEDRVKNLEISTSLSLLELNTKTLQIKDGDGIDRFKTGFFADSFKDESFVDTSNSLIEVDVRNNRLTPIKAEPTLPYKLAASSNVSDSSIDVSQDYELLDNRVKKTGDIVTLNYNKVEWISQPLATLVENVNPYEVTQYVGDIVLHPFRDIWVRPIQLESKEIILENKLTLEPSTSINTTDIALNFNNTSFNTQGKNITITGDNITARDNWLDLSLSESNPESKPIIASDSSDSNKSIENTFVDSVKDEYMRSRNTEFKSSNLTAHTQYYAFLDGNNNIDIIPKLLEVTSDASLNNPGTNKSFQKGEIVDGFIGGNSKPIITFRLCYANHKSGQYDNPNAANSVKYDINPYDRTPLSDGYTASSAVLNIDTFDLAEETAEDRIGYLVKGAQLVGRSSGASAYVKDLRLFTDNYGDLIGTFFIRNPYSDPAPATRISTGNKTFKLSSDPNNTNGLPNDTTISTAEVNYVSEGTVNKFQEITRLNRVSIGLKIDQVTRTKTLSAIRNSENATITLPPRQQITNVTNVTNITQVVAQQRHADPLAQTFIVGAPPQMSVSNDDQNGVFLVGVDLFFASKDSGDAPVTVQIREVEIGTPTRNMLGDSVVLRPKDIKTSTDGSVATHVSFKTPLYLPANTEYSLVLLAPESNQYTVWCAKMHEKVQNPVGIAEDQVRYTKQFAIGSLFKSQNGSTWTPDQTEDLKFKLYKAEFTEESGVVYLENPNLPKQNLLRNPIKTLPRKLKVGITTVKDSNLVNNLLTIGRKVGPTTKTQVHGTIIGTGCSVSSVAINTGGTNYPVGVSTVETFNITGNGSGLKLEINVGSDGYITSASNIISFGSGYSIGDVVGIVTSTVTGTNNTPKGKGARITITGNNSAIDTLYLSNVVGESFTQNSVSQLDYYDNSGNRVTLGSTYITSSSTYDTFYDGKYFKVDHFNHGMYAVNNIIQISNVLPDTPNITLSANITENSTTIPISVTESSYFETFEGYEVSDSNPGYLLIDGEIIKYTEVNSTSIGKLTRGIEAGINGTLPVDHTAGSSLIRKYELGGVSLRRINKTHNIVDFGIDLDGYYLEINREGLENSINFGLSRVDDINTVVDSVALPMLSFNSEKAVGGSNVSASQNIIYDEIEPNVSGIEPPTCKITAQMKSITATSCGGNEVSYTDLEYEDISLNNPNKLSSLRMIASKTNSDEYLDSIVRNKSNVLAITLTTKNKNLSPLINTNLASAKFRSFRLNNPNIDYIVDGRVNSLENDPHQAIYVSKTIRLSQPSRSLKVILSAYRHSSSDFRVLYSLIKPESNQKSKVFALFPGYSNLITDNNLDGYLDVIDETQNSGLPDFNVPSSLENQFLEYQYTAANVGPFIGFTIKIVMYGTRQDKVPMIKDIRAIALAT